MKHFIAPIVLLVFLFTSLNSIKSYSQQPTTVRSKNAMNALPGNYTSFTVPYHNTGAEALKYNSGYEQNPEVGMLFAETPCDNCFELIGKRTEISKTFIKEGTDGKDILQQTSSAPMHYRDAHGNWRTIKTQLSPDNTRKGVYAATEQPTPVSINAADKYTSLGKAGQSFRFNNNVELIYAKPDGTEVSLGNADWSNHTAGDDGVYVTNAWPGIDMEMYVVRGAIKTNFVVNHAMPEYADGRLLVRDHLQMDNGLKLYAEGKTKFAGNLEIRNNADERVYAISAATAFEKRAVKTTLQLLDYYISGNTLDISLPGSFLNRPEASYPVIIDPLVSIATLSAATGSTYSSSFTTGCVYNNPATVPAMITVTDVQFTFQYVTSAGALLNNGAFDFYLSTCRSPVPTYLFWNCNSILTGTCTGTDATILPALVSCMPPPQCASYDLNLKMNFYQNYGTDVPCGIAYISAGMPLTITVSGHTVETSGITALPSIVCQGQSTTLSATTAYGVPPYTYTWTPGGYTGSSITITPASTTSYTVTARDACGNTSSSSTTIDVNPIAPITGTTTICLGGSSTLGNTVTGGTWSSGSPSVATVGAATGIVYGASTGSATITYTTGPGCVSTKPVTIIPQVAAIAGTLGVCQGGSITLTDATAGGTWSSSNTSVATIGPSSGFLSGINGGTSTIVYTTAGAGCSASAVVTVSAIAPITGTTTVCYGGTSTLANAIPGGTWSSGNITVATVGISSGVVTGASVGTAGITYSMSPGCASSTTVIVNPLTPIAGTPAVCQGSTTALSDATSGGTWSSLSPSVASVNPASGLVGGVLPGVSTIRYTTSTGCIANVDVTVNALPGPIAGAALVCSSISLSDPVTGGSWTSGSTSVATVGAATGVVTGVSSGTVTITYTMGGGCLTTTTLNVDPISAVTGVSAVCQGYTTTLSYPATGGLWSSGSVAVATVGATGVVSGASSGTATVSYSLPSGCVATKVVTVNALSPISGGPSICQGRTITLTDPTSGTWASSNLSVATVGLASGIAGGVAPGSTTITFTTAAGCTATKTITVNPLSPITGTPVVCQGSNTTLSDATTGGTWASLSIGVATIDPANGTVSGLAAGTSLIQYTTIEGCIANVRVTVNALPTPIVGLTSVCQGSTTPLTNGLSGGTWISSDPSVASVGASSGIVYGLNAGAVNIMYVTAAGCFVTAPMTVNPITAITGIASVCAGSTTTLTDATPGGSWSTANAAIATAEESTGLISGVSAGTTAIIYITDAGCVATKTVTVYAFPSVIAGTMAVCVNSSTTLSNTLSGGTWHSSDISVATIGAGTGITNGVSAGTATISYTTTGNCYVTATVTVNPLPANITGTAYVCEGSTTALTDATADGAWSSSLTGIATIDASSGVVSGLSAGTTIIRYTTPAGCFKTTPLTVNPLPSLITGTTTVCEGATTTLHDLLAGGTWSSSDIGVAGISISSGVLSGIAAGTATITYTSLPGCIRTTNVLVNPTPRITNTLFTGPTKCTTTDGTITLTGLVPGGIYTVAYTFGGAPVTSVITANGLGEVVITGLASGSYTGITVTTTLGCTSNIIAGPIVLDLPPTPPAPTAGNNTPICAGSDVKLTATDATSGVTYSWTGPLGFTSNLQNPIIPSSTTNESGVYSVTATKFECTSAPGTTTVVVHPIPAITNVTFTNPTTCEGTNGTMTIAALASGVTYTVYYDFNGTPATATGVADGSGNVLVTGLASGTYSVINVSSFTCVSNTVGPVILTDPAPPPVPVLGSNAPICAGKTLKLSGKDDITDVTYEWAGPNGFIADLQFPEIPGVKLADSGVYTLTVRYLNCTTSATEFITIHPPVELKDVTANQVIPYGSTIQLYADGAEYYLWSPYDGSLSNPNIPDPKATPQDSITYTVEGMNRWGCVDYAYVNIVVDFSVNEFLPTGFTPNGDGLNDVFRIGNIKYDKLVDFRIFNRWGQLMYQNSYDPKQGWDGTYKGVPQDVGTYYYNIVLGTPDGKTKNFKGEITLIR